MGYSVLFQYMFLICNDKVKGIDFYPLSYIYGLLVLGIFKFLSSCLLGSSSLLLYAGLKSISCSLLSLHLHHSLSVSVLMEPRCCEGRDWSNDSDEDHQGC